MWKRPSPQSAHIIEQTWTTQPVEPAFLEPEACLAMPQGDGIKVYSQSQGSTYDQKQIADILKLPLEKVEVELAASGGAFGAKEELTIQGQTALAAFLLQRPVKTVLTRKQSTQHHVKRHPMTLKYKVGADAEGHLLAVRVRIVGDTGGYAGTGGKCLLRAACHSCGVVSRAQRGRRSPRPYSPTIRPAAPCAASAATRRSSRWKASWTCSRKKWASMARTSASGTF